MVNHTPTFLLFVCLCVFFRSLFLLTLIMHALFILLNCSCLTMFTVAEKAFSTATILFHALMLSWSYICLYKFTLSRFIVPVFFYLPHSRFFQPDKWKSKWAICSEPVMYHLAVSNLPSQYDSHFDVLMITVCEDLTRAVVFLSPITQLFSLMWAVFVLLSYYVLRLWKRSCVTYKAW